MRTKKYGLLITQTDNIGDEIQALSTRAFLPRIDYYVDRDQVDNRLGDPDDVIYTVMNGWWGHSPECWPPAPNILPLFTSFHLSPFRSPSFALIPAEIFTDSPVVKILHHFGPIGARDYGTMKALTAASVDSFFSGCMTLTLKRPEVARDQDLIIVNDVPGEIEEFIRSRTTKQVQATRHSGYSKLNLESRFEVAEQLLRLYASAHCVITTRLHCALPCVAMGTPVVLLETADDPQRFAGLIDFVDHCTIEDFTAGAYDFNSAHRVRDNHLATVSVLSKNVKTFVDSPIPSEVFAFSENELRAIRQSNLRRIGSEIEYLRKRVRDLRSKQSR